MLIQIHKKLKVDQKFFGCAWCGQSGLWTLNWLYLKNEQMELTDFLHTGHKFMQIKRRSKILGVDMVKNDGCGQSGDGTLKLTVSEEWTDGRTDILPVDTDSQILKADQIFFEWAWSKMGVASLVMGL